MVVSDITSSSTSRLRAHSSFIALLAILFLTFLDNTVVSAVLTSVQADLHAGVSELQWVVGGYALAFASLMLMSGSLADNFGRKRVMLMGVCVFCAGSLLAALATSVTALIVGRVVMGVGAAASEPGTLSMIRHIYPDHRRRSRALGAWAAVSGLALAAGPVIGGVVVGIWTWRAVFWLNLVFGAIALVIGVLALPESRVLVRRRLDPFGFVLVALALGCVTFATIMGESAGYRSGAIITLYVLSAIFFTALIVFENRRRDPMLNLAFFRHRSYAGANFIAFTSYFSIFSIFFFVALYLEVVASISAYDLAIDFLPLLGGMVIASLLSGRWVARSGSRPPLTWGCLLAALGVLLTNQFISPAADLSRLGWSMGIAGIGFGIIIVPVNSAALTSVPADDSGVAASTINTSRELGAVTGVAILGSIVNAQLTVNLTQRLIAIGIPPAFRAEIITAVTTGSVNSQAAQVSGQSSAAIRQIIHKVVSAAYHAFGEGLNISLSLAAVMLIISAIVGYSTGSSRRNQVHGESLLSPSVE